MERNENGYPQMQPTPKDNGRQGGCTGQGNKCGGGTVLDDFPLAYVYAPDQKFRMLYSADDALRHGTLFEELYKPMEVYGCE